MITLHAQELLYQGVSNFHVTTSQQSSFIWVSTACSVMVRLCGSRNKHHAIVRAEGKGDDGGDTRADTHCLSSSPIVVVTDCRRHRLSSSPIVVVTDCRRHRGACLLPSELTPSELTPSELTPSASLFLSAVLPKQPPSCESKDNHALATHPTVVLHCGNCGNCGN